MTEPTIPASATYRYYVGWSSADGRTGGTEIRRTGPIRTLDDVANLAEFLKGHYKTEGIAVTGFSRFDDPDQTGDRIAELERQVAALVANTRPAPTMIQHDMAETDGRLRQDGSGWPDPDARPSY